MRFCKRNANPRRRLPALLGPCRSLRPRQGRHHGPARQSAQAAKRASQRWPPSASEPQRAVSSDAGPAALDPDRLSVNSSITVGKAEPASADRLLGHGVGGVVAPDAAPLSPPGPYQRLPAVATARGVGFLPDETVGLSSQCVHTRHYITIRSSQIGSLNRSRSSL